MFLLLISLVSAHNYVVDPTLSQAAPTGASLPDSAPPMAGGFINRMKSQGFQHPMMGLAMMDGDFGDFGEFGDFADFGDFPFFPMAAAATRQARQYGSGAKPTPTSAQKFNPFAAYAFMDFLNKPRAVAPINPVRLSSPLQATTPTSPTAPASPMGGMMNNFMGTMRQYPLFGMSFLEDPEDPFDKMSDYVGDFPFFPMAANSARRYGSGAGAGAKKSMPSSFNPMAAYAFMDFLNKPRAVAPITPVRLSAPGPAPMSMAMMDVLNKPRPEAVLSSPRKTFIQPVVYPNGEVLYYPVEPVNEPLRQ